MDRNEYFLKVAQEHKPILHPCEVEPVATVQFHKTELGVQCETMPDYRQQTLDEGDSLVLDFGNHYVGKLMIQLTSVGSHQDAPAWVRLRFAERPEELFEDIEAYHGWISKGWIQQEEMHLDVLPATVHSKRRYAFRYLKIEVLAVSSKFKLMVQHVACMEQTSAPTGLLVPYESDDRLLVRMDEIACRTLRNCMHDVFEDGPKRDRRLWMGDLRLQALANYETYEDYSLVKRCLYLFAGSTMPGGRVGACLFVEPNIEVDDTVMFDYSLFFLPTLCDYVEASGDDIALRDLWPTALNQIELVQENFDENNIVRDSEQIGWCFVDWNLYLNKQASAQGIYLYCVQAGIRLAEAVGDTETAEKLRYDYEVKLKAARTYLWDASQQMFVSGEKKQLSWASQIWMVLGGAVSREEGADLLMRLQNRTDAVEMVTPYMYHHYVDALLHVGEKDKALQVLKDYWGGMVKMGADTFWELYNPMNPNESPYGGTVVNSYCHAWSCAPAYFLRHFWKK